MANDRPRPDRADVAAILNATSAMLGERPVTFILAALVYGAVCTGADLYRSSWAVEMSLYGATVLVASILQYAVLRRVFGAAGRGPAAAVVMPVIAIIVHQLSWIAASLALLLFVLPGCYVAGRLSPAVGIVVAEGGGVFGSIAQSWRRTRASAWPLMWVQLLLLVPVLATMGVTVVWLITEPTWLSWDEAETETAVLTNVILALAAMAAWAVAGASYQLTAGRRVEHDAAIFA